MESVASAIARDDRVQIRRVNDRVNKPVPSTLWSDIMFNFTMRDDTNRHVCEVQIVHKMMADVSEALSQHDDYDVVRVAAGILRARCVDVNKPMPPQSSGDGIETEDESKGGSSPKLQLPQHSPRLRQALDRLSELEEELRPRMGDLGRYPAPPPVPARLTLRDGEAMRKRMRRLVPKGDIKRFKPRGLISYATGRRKGRRRDSFIDAEGTGPGMCHAIWVAEVLEASGMTAFGVVCRRRRN